MVNTKDELIKDLNDVKEQIKEAEDILKALRKQKSYIKKNISELELVEKALVAESKADDKRLEQVKHARLVLEKLAEAGLTDEDIILNMGASTCNKTLLNKYRSGIHVPQKGTISRLEDILVAVSDLPDEELAKIVSYDLKYYDRNKKIISKNSGPHREKYYDYKRKDYFYVYVKPTKKLVEFNPERLDDLPRDTLAYIWSKTWFENPRTMIDQVIEKHNKNAE